MDDYSVARGSGVCAGSGRRLAEGEAYYTALFERDDELARADYSVEAWSGPPEGCFCYWKSRVPIREKKPATMVVDTAVLVNLFGRLEESDRPASQQFRFVLALLLMRKRLLKLETTRQEGETEHWQMRLLADGSIHQVVNPRLTPEVVDQLNDRLSALLSGKVEAFEMVDGPGEGADPEAPPADPGAGSDPAAPSDAAPSDAVRAGEQPASPADAIV